MLSVQPTYEELQLENRELHSEHRRLRIDLAAAQEQASARLALSEHTLLVSEDELPRYIPFTLAQVKKLRKVGKLRYISDPLGRKTKFLYNLRDVEASMLAGKPKEGPILKEINWDRMRKVG